MGPLCGPRDEAFQGILILEGCLDRAPFSSRHLATVILLWKLAGCGRASSPKQRDCVESGSVPGKAAGLGGCVEIWELRSSVTILGELGLCPIPAHPQLGYCVVVTGEIHASFYAVVSRSPNLTRLWPLSC